MSETNTRIYHRALLAPMLLMVFSCSKHLSPSKSNQLLASIQRVESRPDGCIEHGLIKLSKFWHREGMRSESFEPAVHDAISQMAIRKHANRYRIKYIEGMVTNHKHPRSFNVGAYIYECP